jgi:hypothetical protein
MTVEHSGALRASGTRLAPTESADETAKQWSCAQDLYDIAQPDLQANGAVRKIHTN